MEDEGGIREISAQIFSQGRNLRGIRDDFLSENCKPEPYAKKKTREDMGKMADMEAILDR